MGGVEYWSTGVLEYWFEIHYSIVPLPGVWFIPKWLVFFHPEKMSCQ